MSSEILSISESNGKRKIKNKAPKRLRRKNKPVENDTEKNETEHILATDNGSLTNERPMPDNVPTVSSTSSITMDEVSYWKTCTKKAMDLLERQASNRRKLFIERHQERIDCIQCVLQQRQQICMLSEKYHSISQSYETLRDELRTKDERLKILDDRLHDRDELIRDNEFLRVQFRLVEQKCERLTVEYNKKLEETHCFEQEANEQIESLMDEIERIKRDLVLEEYRKQEAERKVRYYDEKLLTEQTGNKKMQQDLIQLRQELKSIHMRYDALQIEMLAMHKANNNDVSLIPTKDTSEKEWPSQRVGDRGFDEHVETKRSKRKTRDRTESSTSRTSSSSEHQTKVVKKLSKNKENDSDNPSLNRKKKSLKSNQTNKNHLPMVTVTQASPSIDQPIVAERDAGEKLFPSSRSATSDSSATTSDSHSTSSESQLLKPRTKKPSRYPCRRAQRPKQNKSSLYNDDFIPIDDFSHEFIYESHLGRSCKNVIVVSARHPHSFFLQTVDDLTHGDNFFSKMNEFYNRCFDAQRLAISKAALRANLCCVARDETYPDVWNRAQLLEYHRETDQCSLLLVDLGTWQECVPRANLRHILVPFRNECVRSVPCRLAGVAPAKPEKNGLWSECDIPDAIKTFRNVIDNVPTEVEVLDRSPNGSYFVNLFVTHETFVCVNDFLLYHKIAIPIDDCKTLKPEELDPVTHKPLLAIIYEFNLQGKLLAEEIEANELKQKEEQKKKYEEEQQRQSNCRLPCIRIIDIFSPTPKKLIFARYNKWVMIPWFCISSLFEPPLSESTIERFAILYKFSPVMITPLTNAVLCAHLEKCMPLVNYDAKPLSHGYETKIALYSIDCVRKLLLNHRFDNEFLFERLDEGREAEMKEDLDFWEVSSSQQNYFSVDSKKSNEKSKQSKIALLKSHKDQLESRLERMTLSNPEYQSIQRQLMNTMEELCELSNDSSSSY
ncbi:unnamed protein product [Adineta ricciae]|uniref:Tudor domain-containing protein n=1 Tax=Adineta ricciae TaxID=249248 RepID=A0A815CP41_ADIRI|nr:unnamed protein product [Adineta ricciae]